MAKRLTIVRGKAHVLVVYKNIIIASKTARNNINFDVRQKKERTHVIRKVSAEQEVKNLKS